MTTQSWDELRGDYIDSRQIIERLAELEDAAAEDPSDLGCTFCGEGSMPSESAPSLCEDHADELSILRDFADQGSNFSDWQYGETFIPEDQFKDYARELAEDIGAVNDDAGWPNRHIDWEAAARELRMDYSEVIVDGVTYLARS